MINTEVIGTNALKVIVPQKVKAEDFKQIEPLVDSLITEHGQIRLLIDATGFNGWENLTSFETHVGFVKDHQKKIEKIAVIAGHEWQHWLVAVVRIFAHPEARAFEKARKQKP